MKGNKYMFNNTVNSKSTSKGFSSSRGSSYIYRDIKMIAKMYEDKMTSMQIKTLNRIQRDIDFANKFVTQHAPKPKVGIWPL